VSSNFSRSALTDGLELNLKITTKEVGHIIDKFKKTFEAYWQNPEFELYNIEKHREKLIISLKEGKFSKEYVPYVNFFDIKPFHYQQEILENLDVERTIHNRYKNLIVAATGTGKTVISAFDYKRFKSQNKSARLLFVAHRKEILQQALSTFQGVLKDNNFGELWVDGIEPISNEYLFASVQTLNNRLVDINLSSDYFDFIIIDEVHHIEAKTYRPILEYFKPKVLVGLTATPERMDGADILKDFSDRIAAEIRLPEALNKKILSPFQYFGITDSIDLSNVKWQRGRYLPSELTNLYTQSDRRVRDIISNLQKYLNDITDVRAIGFCVTMEHAKYMAEKFSLAGLKATYLTSENSKDRERFRTKLKNQEINYLFVVDIFNEGVDIPEIDTVLFLRPTESLTVFLQQLGRGLRLSEGKDCLTVLDFVGNARPEYDFENKFRALIGKTTTSVYKEIEDNFPHLPLGCSIVLEKKTKEVILENIKKVMSMNVNQLITKIINFKHQTTLPLTLNNFIKINSISLESIYKKDNWSRLRQRAGVIEDFNSSNEKQIYSAIKNKWFATNSLSYFEFILKLAKQNFKIHLKDFIENELSMLLMLHYDVWQNASGFNSLEESINQIGESKILVNEIIEVLELLIDRIDFKEIEIKLPYDQPLKVHGRYTRDQILAAFKLSTFEAKSSSREGVAENAKLNTELLFINLIKSDDDYAISETLFHWQSQNSSRPDLGKGLSYINQKENDKKILLFVREKSKDESGNTMGYVFIGEAKFKKYEGEKPMNIEWQLNEPIPNYLWKESAKMSVG
jgi:superfamily II DNA or RNA helicase